MATTTRDPRMQCVVDGDFVELVPIRYARFHGLVLLRDRDAADTTLAYARLTPDLLDAAQAVGRLLERELTLVQHPEAQIQEWIDQAYEARSGLLDKGEAFASASELARPETWPGSGSESQDLLDADGQRPVIRLVNTLLLEAVRRGASDLHFQPVDGQMAVRMRIDGLLRAHTTLPASVQNEVISRLKVMAGMDVAERRLPQDGRATVELGNRQIDLRVATIDSQFGERLVVRLLERSGSIKALDQLGMSDAMACRFRELMASSHGLILVTGPTGAGKTTTLYAALQCVDSATLNVVTIEDPIESRLSLITQTQVNERKGITFATALRSVLRQDPDVILVGEIRDADTARLAVQAAMTGHLVIATLHTNSAIGAIGRLADLGVERFRLGDAVLGVLAQRLVRRICPACSGSASESACARCEGSGTFGREGIFELLTVDAALRSAIASGASSSELLQTARSQGFTELSDDATRKVESGLIARAEANRVLNDAILPGEV
jgi:general secretion pathway protein E